MNEFDDVILANGSFPSHPIPLNLLRNAKQVVCCDGAVECFDKWRGTPAAIVGDGDSLSDELKEKYADIWHPECEQETNDLTKAVRYLMNQGSRHFAIVGATGKREDHTLGNISLLIEYLRMGAKVEMYTDYGHFVPCSRFIDYITSRPGQPVSIFNFNATNFRSTCLRYPIYDFTNWWQGTLNEMTGAMARIDADGDFLVYFPYI